MKPLNILNRQANGQMDRFTHRKTVICMPVTLGGHWYGLMSEPCLSTGSGWFPARQGGLPHDEPDAIGTDVVLKHSTVFPYTGDWW